MTRPARNGWGRSVVIDDARNGGSDDGAWLRHIAHTPHLKAQMDAERAREQLAEAGQ